jgi:general secretion pathway protein D
MKLMSRSLVFVFALAGVLVLGGCTTAKTLRQARQADELRDYDVAVAQYTKVVREHPDNREAQLGLERAKLRAADAHLAHGRRLFAQGKYDDAVLELQIASDLNPTSGDAERDLRAARSAVRAKLAAPAEGKTALETLLSRTRDLPPAGYELPSVKLASQIVTGTQATSRQVYLTIARMANLSVIFDPSFRDAPAPVSLLTDVTVKQALDAVARSTNTFYQITAPNTITVIPDTPAKRREYTEEAERVFMIQNADLKETIYALRVVSDIRSISPVSGVNAVLVRDTPERLQVAGRFLSAFDKARPELVVDVEILEVDRTKLREYGLQIASSGSPGIDGSVTIDETNLTAKSLRNLTQSNVLLGGFPALYYRLLKTDTHTRTLANPHLRMSDGVAATAEFGERIPTPTVTIGAVAQGGVNTVPITAYTYQNIGVNIAITPRVHANDEVTLGLNIELSNVQGIGFGGLPTFGSRKVTTTIRLKDGETNILGGLIRDDERFTKDGIPGLSDVPGLDHLFTKSHKEATETDVVVMLTPHIIRVLDLAEEDLRPLRLSREGVGAALIESQPIAPPPPIIRESGPATRTPASTNPVETPAPLPVKPVPAPPTIIKKSS